MRPAHVFAKPTADEELQIVALLQGPWRFALRLVMIWLSLRGLTASEIAALFEYDPRTVRRWIIRYNEEGVAGLEDRPRSGAPRLGSAGLGRRIRVLLREPRAWTVKQLRRALGYPAMSLATLARRVREQATWRRLRLVAKGDPNEAAVLAALHREIATLPEGAVILAEDESHVNLLPWLRSTWIVKGERQEVMTPGKNQKRSVFGAIELATGRWLYNIAERAISAAFIDSWNRSSTPTPGRQSSRSCSTTSARTPAGPWSAGWLVTAASSFSTAPATLPITTRSSGSGAP